MLFRKMIFVSAMTTAFAASVAIAEDRQMNHGQMDHSGHGAHGKMDHGQMDHGGHEGHGEMKAVQVEPGTEASGIAVINSLDAEKGMVNLTHEPMPELGWPTMTMDLPVTRRVDLSGIKAGDKVDFTIKLGRDKQYRVTGIEAAK